MYITVQSCIARQCICTDLKQCHLDYDLDYI